EAVEERFGIAMPPDLREYFLRLNGTAGGRCAIANGELISFWHLDELATLAAEGVAGIDDGDWFVFADHAVCAYRYAIRLSSDRDAATPVAICYDPPTFEIASTISQFFDAYLRHDYAILFPPPPDTITAAT